MKGRWHKRREAHIQAAAHGSLVMWKARRRGNFDSDASRAANHYCDFTQAIAACLMK